MPFENQTSKAFLWKSCIIKKWFTNCIGIMISIEIIVIQSITELFIKCGIERQK